MLKEHDFVGRGILDGSIKWSLTHMIKQVSKGVPEAKGRTWNTPLCKLGWENAYNSIDKLNPNQGYMPVLKKCVDTFFVMADEKEERKLKGFSKWAIDFGVGFFHRSVIHLIWERADRGCWNRKLSEDSWELAHLLIREIPDLENKGLIKQAIDSAFIITDADDPYYTAYKWWLMNMMKTELPSWQTGNKDNLIYTIYHSFLESVKGGNLLNGLKEDFSPDINKASAQNMTKQNVVIGGPVEEKRKIARKYSPL